MTQALDGIRILDFTQVLAGPFAVMQLALAGADVIKVEQPGSGDQTRNLLTTESGGMSPAFLTCNLNKRGMTLDLKSAEAATIIHALVARTDVVVENFKAGTMSRLGFGYEGLRSIKPDLIYCSISGYGQTGPRAGAAAYDGAIQAASGMMSQTGHPSTGPTRTGYMPVDMATALNASFAISTALLRRERFGTGQHIDVAMLDTAIVLQAIQFANYLNEGQLVELLGNASPTRSPTADVFATKDGHIQITAIRDGQAASVFAVAEIEPLLDARGWRTEAARLQDAAEIKATVQARLTSQTTSFWMERLTKAGVPVAEINGIADVVSDPQLDVRGVITQIDGSAINRPQAHVVTSGFTTDADGPNVRHIAPQLGEHTRDILHEAGFSDDHIKGFVDRGVV